MSQRQQTPTNEDSYLSCGRPSNLLKTSFSSARLEKLYRASSLQQRRGGLTCFLMAAILYGLYTLSTPGTVLLARCISATFLVLNSSFLLQTRCIKINTARNTIWSVMPCIVGQLWIVHLPAQLFLKPVKVTPRDSLAWMLLLLYLLFATLPLKLCRCTSLALGSVLVYFIAVIGLSSATLEDLKTQPVDILVGNSVSCVSRRHIQIGGSSRANWNLKNSTHPPTHPRDDARRIGQRVATGLNRR